MVQGEIKNGEETLNESVTGMVIRAACSPAGGAVAKSIKQFAERTHGETVGQPNFETVRTRRNFAQLFRPELQTFSQSTNSYKCGIRHVFLGQLADGTKKNKARIVICWRWGRW